MLATAAGNQLSAQTILLPDTALRIDKEKVKQCKDMVNHINYMQLRCEMLSFIDREPTFHVQTICFDEEKRLRKYFYKHEMSDGASEYDNIRAYYNENGDLIFIYYCSYGNCDYE